MEEFRGRLFDAAESELEGQVEGITFINEESGYTVAKIKVDGHSQPVTVSGDFLSVRAGEFLKLRGLWYNHPKYGRQFKVASYESVVPANREGIEKYLASGLIKGTGPVIAKRIVAKFGVETIDVIENSISRLREVEGIGEKRLRMIEQSWAGQKGLKEVMIFLQGHGVSASCAVKIFKHYGKDSIKKVGENPYRLAEDIFGIGFVTADRIASNMGIKKDSPRRAEAGILYVLSEFSNEGHVYYPYELLIEKCTKMLDMERDIVLKAFGAIASEGKVIVEGIIGDDIKANDKAVYLPGLYRAETEVADSLKTRLKTTPGAKQPVFSTDAFRGGLGITLSENQVEAVKEVLKNKATVITGGPGTGKTTITNAIIRLYEGSGQKVVLTAPTGRAAKRMTEATGHDAKTIHRLLEYNPHEGGFRRNEKNPLSADLIIVDETSMVDTALMHALMKAVPKDAVLVFVGDAEQLPSIGAGNVLRDIIDSGVVPCVRLDQIFRQSEESLIVVNAHRVNSGRMPVLDPSGGEKQDFYFIEVDEPEKILQKTISLCTKKIPSSWGFDPVRDIQVLTAMNKGLLGVINLNAELQKALNASEGAEGAEGAAVLHYGGRLYKAGDKVMQVVNNYDREIFNGDIGVITAINNEAHEVTVDFDGRRIVYEHKDMDELTHAYAISVHKSQGSEYQAVVMPLHMQQYMLLQRNLLYTAITRGRRLVVLVGARKALSAAINNNRTRKRYTCLKNRLRSH